MGRPLGVDGVVAERLGVKSRFIKRLGGAAKVEALSPEAFTLLMKPGKTWGLQAPKRYPNRIAQQRAYERLVRKMLKERGLVK